MAGVVEHLERFCGVIAEGWNTDPDGNPMPFQIVRIEASAIDDAVIYATLGLSNFQLAAPSGRKQIRHELLVIARKNRLRSNLPAVLQQVAAESLLSGSAYVRGDVIGPREALFTGSDMTAFYVAIPVCFSDVFATIEITGFGTVVFAWLVPITSPEAAFVAARGWEAFEDQLAEQQPDLLDLTRHSIAVPVLMGPAQRPR
jgi:hypothetical protein